MMRIKDFTIVDEDDLVVSQCVWCVHRGEDGVSCEAFPNGIPEEILLNEHDHSEPFEGDGGVRYEPQVLEPAGEKVPA